MQVSTTLKLKTIFTKNSEFCINIMDYFIGTKFKLLFYFLCWSCWSVRFLVFSTPLSLTPSLPHSLTPSLPHSPDDKYLLDACSVCVTRLLFLFNFCPPQQKPICTLGWSDVDQKNTLSLLC